VVPQGVRQWLEQSELDPRPRVPPPLREQQQQVRGEQEQRVLLLQAPTQGPQTLLERSLLQVRQAQLEWAQEAQEPMAEVQPPPKVQVQVRQQVQAQELQRAPQRVLQRMRPLLLPQVPRLLLPQVPRLPLPLLPLPLLLPPPSVRSQGRQIGHRRQCRSSWHRPSSTA
jgi:hypothetical protein